MSGISARPYQRRSMRWSRQRIQLGMATVGLLASAASTALLPYGEPARGEPISSKAASGGPAGGGGAHPRTATVAQVDDGSGPAVPRTTGGDPRSAPAAAPVGYPVTGIDVSNHQGTIVWPLVAASGQRFAYIKATEGVHFVDPYFASNQAGAKANMLFAGAYHFARPDRSSGAAQADFLLARMQYANDGRTLPPMLDVEWPWPGSGSLYPCYGLAPKDIVAWIHQFVDRIRQRTGLTTVIYTATSWWNLCTASNPSFGDLPLVLARYAAAPGPLPAGWDRFTFWQYTSQATIPGITGRADHDVFHGSLGDLARLAGSLWPRVLGDFNGDGLGEAAVWRPTHGTWWVAYSGGGGAVVSWGLPGDVPLVADPDGDHRDDYVVWRPSTGEWWVRYANGSGAVVQWGLPADYPLAGDLDGDGRDDLAVWRPSNGTWWIRYSSGGNAIIQWGLPGDVPLLGDVNGDGRDDLVTWRASTGTWWVRNSTGTIAIVAWGLRGDIPLLANVGGDGRDDLVVWRPSDGTWWLLYTSGGGARVSWGLPGDRPLTGHVGGDSRDDFVVWRPSTAGWWVLSSDNSGQVADFRWGIRTDVPL